MVLPNMERSTALFLQALADGPGPQPAPAVVAAIRAINNGDLEALLAQFAEDALVNDQLRDYWGKAAIRQWAAADIIGDKVRMGVVQLLARYGQVVVIAHVDGEYDKRGLPEPLVLTFYFSAADDKIVQLIILRNLD